MVDRTEKINEVVHLSILKKTGNINFWNISLFKNCAIASKTNASPYNKRPMIINALVASNNSPNSRHRNM